MSWNEIPRPPRNVKKGDIKRVVNKPLTEHEEQVRVVAYLRKTGRLFFAVPNAAKRNMRLAAYMKAEGLTPGVLDLWIPMPRKGFAGLVIEMKPARSGKLSDHQEYWIEQLNKQGYKALCAHGANAAITVIEDYFKE